MTKEIRIYVTFSKSNASIGFKYTLDNNIFWNIVLKNSFWKLILTKFLSKLFVWKIQFLFLKNVIISLKYFDWDNNKLCVNIISLGLLIINSLFKSSINLV